MWFFPRDAIPLDITSDSPDPTLWGDPVAHFPFGDNCNWTHFQSHKIVLDNTFCGDWAGVVYNSDGCNGMCTTFVSNNPSKYSFL